MAALGYQFRPFYLVCSGGRGATAAGSCWPTDAGFALTLACHDARTPTLPSCRSSLHSLFMSLQALHLKALHLSRPLLV